MNNEWAEPEGVSAVSAPILYRIKSKATGTVQTHKTTVTMNYYYDGPPFSGPTKHTAHHELHIMDQEFAIGLSDLIQQVCSYFYTPPDEEWEPMRGVFDIVVTDDEVRTRIRRINMGENYREAMANRGEKHVYYDLEKLPFAQQRALIEQIEKYKRDWEFEIIGPDPEWKDYTKVIQPLSPDELIAY